MHSLTDNSKLNLNHMGRSNFFKNHSNKLNFQNPSICRLTSTNLAHHKKSFQNSKLEFLRPFHQTLGGNKSNWPNFTVLSSNMAKQCSPLVTLVSLSANQCLDKP